MGCAWLRVFVFCLQKVEALANPWRPCRGKTSRGRAASPSSRPLRQTAVVILGHGSSQDALRRATGLRGPPCRGCLGLSRKMVKASASGRRPWRGGTILGPTASLRSRPLRLTPLLCTLFLASDFRQHAGEDLEPQILFIAQTVESRIFIGLLKPPHPR